MVRGCDGFQTPCLRWRLTQVHQRHCLDPLGDQETAEELAARWRDQGAQLYGSPWTEPLSLQIPSQPEAENCEAGITEEAIAIPETRLKESGSSPADYDVLAEDQGPAWLVTLTRRDDQLHGFAAEYCVNTRIGALIFFRQPG